tara:strand:+ start:15215 stop:15763 length:549 start_codon:yes stop_codon:yes gene_type:complete
MLHAITRTQARGLNTKDNADFIEKLSKEYEAIVKDIGAEPEKALDVIDQASHYQAGFLDRTPKNQPKRGRFVVVRKYSKIPEGITEVETNDHVGIGLYWVPGFETGKGPNGWTPAQYNNAMRKLSDARLNIGVPYLKALREQVGSLRKLISGLARANTEAGLVARDMQARIDQAEKQAETIN